MAGALVKAQGRVIDGAHYVRVSGQMPAQWGPMPKDESLQKMSRYCRALGSRVQLETRLPDGTVLRHGFTPDGQIITLPSVPSPAPAPAPPPVPKPVPAAPMPVSSRPVGGMGAAWAAEKPAEGAPRAAGSPGPAPVYGTDTPLASWADPVPEVETILVEDPAAPKASPRARSNPLSGLLAGLSGMTTKAKVMAGAGLAIVAAGAGFAASGTPLPF